MADDPHIPSPPRAQIVRSRRRQEAAPVCGDLSLEEQLRRLEAEHQGDAEPGPGLVAQLGMDVYELAQDVLQIFETRHQELYPGSVSSTAWLSEEAARREREAAQREQREREEVERRLVLQQQRERARRQQEEAEARRQEVLRLLEQEQALQRQQQAQQALAKQLAQQATERLAQERARQERERARERREQEQRELREREIAAQLEAQARQGVIYSTQPVAARPARPAHLMETGPGLQFESSPGSPPDHEQRAQRLDSLTSRYFERKAAQDRERLRHMVKGSHIEREVHEAKLERLERRAQELSSESSLGCVVMNTPVVTITASPAREAFNRAFQAFKKQFYIQSLPMFQEAYLAEPTNGLYMTFYAYTLFLTDANRKDEAERLLRQAIESADRQALPDAHLFLGYVLRTMPERAAKALKHFELALELNPHSHEAKRALRLEQRRKERHSSLGNQLIPWAERK